MQAIEKACSIMRTKLGSHAWRNGQRLPTLSELALLCDVSRSTMWRALVILQKESLLHARKGGMIIAGPAGSIPEAVNHHGVAWRRLKDRLGREILAGTLASGDLPPINKLARQYAVAIDTCKKALHALTAEGLLTREGRRFKSAFARSSRQHKLFVLISGGDSERGVAITDPRTNTVIDSFERECFRLGFQAHCEGFDGMDSSARIKTLANLSKLGFIAGYIVNMWDPGTDEIRQRWLDMMQALLHRKTPVVVLDQDGAFKFPPDLLNNPDFRALRITSERAGEITGQFLINSGHRNIIFITPTSTWEWATARFRGLQRCFRNYCGTEASVTQFYIAESFVMEDLNIAALGLNAKDFQTVFKAYYAAKDLDIIAAKLNRDQGPRFKESYSSADPAVAALRMFGKFMVDFAGSCRHPWTYDKMVNLLGHIASNTGREKLYEPVLAELSKKSTATAWVCSEDQTAYAALVFLRNAGKKVPKDISIIGFENWPEAKEHQMTTYDFNIGGMLQQALLLIMDKKSREEALAVSEVDGYVVERRTTARLPQKTDRLSITAAAG